MSDPGAVVLSSGDPAGLVRAVNALLRSFPPDVRVRLNMAKLHYLTEYGLDGLYARFNGRTVAEVLAGYTGPRPEVIVEGAEDGVRYTLFRLPQAGPGSPDPDVGPVSNDGRATELGAAADRDCNSGGGS